MAGGGAAGPRIVLVRHGESTFNADQVFTGLLDIPLSEHGTAQIDTAAALMREAGLLPGRLVSSPLCRALDTATGLRDRLAPGLSVETSWRLAERDYGCMTGVPKRECRERWGEDAFFTWRRTMHGAPPPASPEQRADWPQDTGVDLGPLVPGISESLADVVERVRPLWRELATDLRSGGSEPVTVVAHGNSLRALCLLMSGLSDEEVERVNIPAAQPLVFDFPPAGEMRPLERLGRYLDPVTATLEAAKVEAEGGT